jgi:hypothetical protein
MPKFDANTPRLNVKVLENTYTLPAVYAAGHVLTEAEAKYMSRQVATSVVNAVPSAIKSQADGWVNKAEDGTITPLTPEQLQAKLDERFAAYEPGAINRGAVGEPTDPIERLIHRMAIDFLNARLKAAKRNINEVKATKAEGSDKTVYQTLLEQVLATKSDNFRPLAEAQLAAMADTTEEIDLDLGTAPEAVVDPNGTDAQPIEGEPATAEA